MPSSYAWNGWTFSAVLISLLFSLAILTIIYGVVIIMSLVFYPYGKRRTINCNSRSHKPGRVL